MSVPPIWSATYKKGDVVVDPDPNVSDPVAAGKAFETSYKYGEFCELDVICQGGTDVSIEIYTYEAADDLWLLLDSITVAVGVMGRYMVAPYAKMHLRLTASTGGPTGFYVRQSAGG